jgi:hypothetical protein
MGLRDHVGSVVVLGFNRSVAALPARKARDRVFELPDDPEGSVVKLWVFSAGNQLQLVEPGRSVIAPGTLTFVVFRRDLVSNAPEKVPLRIAARVARSMNFDSAGKAVMTTPATETWIIRDQGYNLRCRRYARTLRW